MPQSRMVSATRATSWRTPVSRSGVPILPCRYLLATMLVAVMDQSLGTSTSFCSKMTLPWASVIWRGGDPIRLRRRERRRLGEEAAEGEAGGLLLSGAARDGTDEGGRGGFGYGFQFCHGLSIIRFYACRVDSGVRPADGGSGVMLIFQRSGIRRLP